MEIKELKEKLHLLIESSTNETLLEDLLLEVQKRSASSELHVVEGLSKEDYEDLVSLVTEPAEKDTLSYDELKSSLSRWFTK